MAISLTDLGKTDIVAGQKVYAATETARIDLINANNSELEAKCVATEGNQTITGVKTFSSLPKIPTTAPTADAEAASKKYVDDEIKDIIGAASSKSVDTNYQASTSGLLVVRCTFTWNITAASVIVYSDSGTPPTTDIGSIEMNMERSDSQNNISAHTITIPIIKDDYYRVADIGTVVVDSINFYPLTT